MLDTFVVLEYIYIYKTIQNGNYKRTTNRQLGI